jgi:small subunit ribosomal protein S2
VREKMADKDKKENIIEKVKDVIEDVVEKTEEVVEDIVDNVKDLVKGKKKVGKKSSSKKVAKTKETAKTALEEKLKAIESKFKEAKKVDIKEQVTGEISVDEDTLVPIEDYLKSSMHLGTRVITPHMRKYIYKRRADGLAVFNTSLLNKMIIEGAEYLSGFSPEQIVVVCKREAGWGAVNKFAETLGIKVFTKKYPAGTLTNTNLDDFFERDLVLISDPWLDKNALKDANKIKMKVMSICDSNNYTFGIDNFVIGNNKSGKSLGMVFYLLGKLYAEKRGIEWNLKIEDFIDDWENLVPPK